MKVVLILASTFALGSVAQDSISGLHFEVDKNYLVLNPQTDRNEVRFRNVQPDNPGEALTDLSGCLRMKLDLAAQQVSTCWRAATAPKLIDGHSQKSRLHQSGLYDITTLPQFSN